MSAVSSRFFFVTASHGAHLLKTQSVQHAKNNAREPMGLYNKLVYVLNIFCFDLKL